jgi:plastocyanin
VRRLLGAGAGTPAALALALAVPIGGSATLALPALAGAPTAPSVDAIAKPGTGESEFSWSPERVEVAQGTSVSFADSTPGIPHGIKWTSAIEPTCEKGVPVDEEATGWSGACTFTQPGAYTFRCTVHAYMTGEIVVSAGGGSTTTTTTQTTAEGTPAPQGSAEPPASRPGSLFAAGRALILARRQRGATVRGSVDVSPLGAGASLTIELLARLAPAHRQTPAGRLVKRSLRAGEVRFAVRLDALARAALERRRSLALTAKISLLSRQGSMSVLKREIVLHS